MSTDERMTVSERRMNLRTVQKCYNTASRRERSNLLDDAQRVTEMHRKSLIRLLAGDLSRKRRRRQRGCTYGSGVESTLRVIAESFDYPCAERLQPNLPWMAAHLAQHGKLELSPGLLDQLGRISVSSVRRLLQRQSPDQPRLPRKCAEQTNRFRGSIPQGVSPGKNPIPDTSRPIWSTAAALRPPANVAGRVRRQSQQQFSSRGPGTPIHDDCVSGPANDKGM